MNPRLSDAHPSTVTPAASSASRVTRLPIELTSFVGRREELTAAAERLTTTRLLTLTGAAGSGKTRFALELATRLSSTFDGDVTWVELASIAHGSLVASTALTAIGAPDQPGRSATDALVATLRDRRALLVLDNCEHLIAACAMLADTLLRACPDLRIIATSREALGIGGEVAWLVSPLSIPDGRSSLEESEAVQLFVERARAVLPRFALDDSTAPAVARICRRLDGLPLAIELAAARLRALPVERLAERLDEGFRLLVGGSRTALPRHQTLRAAIDWSYELLSTSERWLLDHLSVFAGSFTLEAAEAVCASDEVREGEVLDLVASLVEKSLLVLLDGEDMARYRLLEAVREYAAERLTARGDEANHRDQHAAYYAAVAQEAEPHLIGVARRGWIARLRRDVDNLRASIEWGAQRDPLLSLRLTGSLCWFWYSAGLWTEGFERLSSALAHPAAEARTPERARALFAIGALATLQGRPDFALPRLEECVTLSREQGDERLEAYALNYIGMAYGQRADARTVVPTEAALAWARRSGDLYASRLALLILGVYWWQLRDFERSLAAMEEGVAVARQFGQERELGIALSCLARLEIDLGHVARGASLARESLAAFAQDPQHMFAARSLEVLGGLACQAGVYDRSVMLMGAAESVRDSVGSKRYPMDAAWFDEHVRKARAQLRADDYELAWQRGRRMSLDQALHLALEEMPASSHALAPAEASGAAPRVRAERASELRVRALGASVIERDGIPMPANAWSYTKPRELLLFLLSHPEGRTRDQVGLALWPDASSAQVRNNFHVTLHHLRKTLGGTEWVQLEGGRYRIAPERDVQFDASSFEAAATEALRRARRGQASVDALRTAVSMYGGDFASLEEFGDWHLELRDRLQRLYADARLALADALASEARHREAVEVLEQLCREDPLDEGAARRLMITLARMGERSAAAAHFHKLRDALRRELGTAPGRESVVLYERLQRGDAV